MTATPDLRSRADAGPAPASAAQRRIWFIDRLNGGDAAYHVPVAVRLLGDLDVPALGRALAAVVARHEALRTVFRTVDGEPAPVVLPPPAGFELPLRPVKDSAELQAAIAAAARVPFDLASGPVIRADLLQTAACGGGHVLVVTAHHVAVDGWSLGVLFTELAELYRAGVERAEPVLADLPVQYGDVARWQAARAEAGLLAGEQDWWRAELAGAPAALELPAEFPRGPRASGEGAVARLRLPPELSDDVQELAQATGGTLYMTMLTAFQVLLARYARTDQLIVGSPVAGRPRPDLEPLIGCFINTLPIRADLRGEPTFRELAGRTRAAALRAFEHQELSFEAIVEAVRPDRTLADTPIFQVLFSVDEAAVPVVRAGGLLWRFLATGRERVKYDLSMTVGRVGADLEIVVEYRADRFGPEWVADLLGAYRTLLAAAVADPDTPVSRLPLLTPAERKEQVQGWNDTAVPYPDLTVVDLIRRRIAADPGAVAVIDGDRRLTYAELGQRSTGLAHRLRTLGAGPGARVGLCLHRSTELVVAILGVLEAGAAYVPLDPAYPAGRLEFVLDDAGADVVLTHAPAAAAIPATAAAVLDLDRLDLDLLDPDRLDPAPPELAVAAPPPGPRPDDAAYVIYTSGSTGRPKGVINTHRGLANRLLWMQDIYGLDGSDAVLQKTPYSFDVSVWEFLWPLFTGARLVVARPDGHRDPQYLAATIREHDVTTVHFVPSMLQVFLEAADLPAGLRRVLCSGEALPAELARRIRGSGTTAELHNLYGPTEAAIDVSSWHCTDADGTGSVPIGRPIANTQLHVLDPYDEPVPTGVPGELVIGGVQVAAGYVNRPELTADRFRTDPFRPGGTVYRTGDLARRRRDGALEFLGRLDHQVKLRGFRIELGEVESGLRELPGIGDVVVTAADERLVAYVTGPAVPEDAVLRRELSRRLPEHMVPAVLVRLDRLPLTSNGKVDRAALPAPDPRRSGAEVRVAPRDGIELELQALWEELLGVHPIGVTEDFFSLGGTSLQVIRMLGRVTERFGSELPVAAMFDGGATVEAVAARLREGATPAGWSPIVPLRAAGSRRPVFCLPPAVGNALSYVDLARRLPPEQPVYGLQAAGLDPGQQPIADLADAAAGYVAAIRKVQPEGPYQLIGYCVGSVTAHAVARQLSEAGQEIALLAVLDGGPPALDNGFEDADQADIAAWFAWELGRAAGRDLVIDPADLSGLTGAALATEVVRRAVAADVLPPDAAQGQLTRLLATFDAGVRAARDYDAEPWPGRILALRAAGEDPAASPVRRFAPLVGGVEEVVVPGDHYSMMRTPHVDTVASELTRAMAAAADAIDAKEDR